METKKAAPKDGLNRSIAPTDYTPTFPPKKDSVTAETLARLLDGQTITQREFYERFSTVNIARHTDPQYIRDVYAARKARRAQ